MNNKEREKNIPFAHDAKRGLKKRGKAKKDNGASTHVSESRRMAHLCLCAIRKRDAYAQDVLETFFDSETLSSEDKAFAAKLVMGVVSSQGTLDEVLDRVLTRPASLNADVREALRISAYELLFLKKDAHVAVDQGVELAKSTHSWSAGLANAVLRKVAQSAKDFPFGNPETDDRALARSQAFPFWLTEKMINDMGRKTAVDFMTQSNTQPDVYLAANCLRADQGEVATVLQEAGISYDVITDSSAPEMECYRLNDQKDIKSQTAKKLLSEGKVLVSDLAAQVVVQAILPPKLPTSCLEVGAGRGTKTVLLQSAMMKRFGALPEVYSTLDKHAFKANLLMERSHCCNLKIDNYLLGDALFLDAAVPGELFDFIFIDAPCSGLGTLRRHPEIRWRMAQSDIDAMAELQLGMLRQAAKHVRVGGLLAYATCTFTREEDSAVVDAFLGSEEGASFKLSVIAERSCLSTLRLQPSSDVHFAVKFQRIA